MKNTFTSTFDYKLIYIFRINDKAHEDLLKIGDATVHTTTSLDQLTPCCKELNKAARARIDSYTKTAGIVYDLLHTEIAIIEQDCRFHAFRDYKVHDVLKCSGFSNHYFDETNKRNEWYKVDLQTAISAIKAVKESRSSLDNSEISKEKSPIIFRPEQLAAINKTVNQFRNGDTMLWNAKMRFGKTLSALEVVKRMDFERTIILTHRPVVSKGWYDDFDKIFYDTDDYKFGSRDNSKGLSIKQLIESNKKYVYFASMQDLRGSEHAGGKFSKNDEIFAADWDFIIIDEAHEGTQTILGENVLEGLKKRKDTKVLHLSGTPFNIMGKFDENEIYTWDYVMEQSAKAYYALNSYGDSNPYEELPRLNIFTYNLNNIIKGYEDFEDKAFNFREFFRTWDDKSINGTNNVPNGATVGDFVHRHDVMKFLDLIATNDAESNYPYSTEEYRSYFRHSLWMVPGVKEAKALSALLKSHPVFGSGAFNIVNVAGDGDEEENINDALKKVETAIGNNPDESYSITISCGRLTTGVSVKAWTTVLMLSGSYTTKASSYMQTIFRVQTPANINGRFKEQCYVFDFAPDRTLKIVAETSKVSSKAGTTTAEDRKIVGDFLNFCPVISINGSNMQPYDVDSMMQQLKKVYTDRVVNSGFDNIHIYNDKLLQLDDLELKEFSELKKIIGSSKQTKKPDEVDINKQGLTNEEYEEFNKLNNKPKKKLTAAEIKRREELKKKGVQKQSAISILRGIAIRIPLLIYGADTDFEQDITVENFTDLIDSQSWEEFMPSGVTKQKFNYFSRYFDPDIFISAGRKIRNQVRNADLLSPTERVKRIAEILSTFKNTDKETVLTPWRVVNMHLGDCLGGYCFYDEEYKQKLETPRLINHGEVTSDTLLNPNTHILELNSKTGLYPLYVAYSIFRRKYDSGATQLFEENPEQRLWCETVAQNIFVVCKTRMAKSITRRTLVGYTGVKVNTHYFDNLINQITNKPNNFIKKIKNGVSYWNANKISNMKFNAIVGNPPYQVMDGGHGVSAKPVYDKFITISKQIAPNYISLIMPSRWFAGGKGLDSFRESMLNDSSMALLFDNENSNTLFPGVDIAGGVCYFLWDVNYNGLCEVVNSADLINPASKRALNEYNIFIRRSSAIPIIRKILSYNENNGKRLNEIVSSRKPFGLPTNYKPRKEGVPCWFTQKIGLQFASESNISDNSKILNKWKLLIPKAPIAGQTDFSKPVGFYYDGNVRIAKPNECCTESWIVACTFDTEQEVLSFKSYLFTKIARFLLLQSVVSQDVTKQCFSFIPDLGVYDMIYTDEILRERWKITDEEWAVIDSRIK